jgi:hypothetical protein
MTQQRTINLIFIGFLFFILNGCSNPKPKAPLVNNDISKYENIIEQFNKRVRSFQNLQVLFFTILSVENKTASDNEIIDKLKLLPKQELEKITFNDKSSDNIINCFITQFDVFPDKTKEVGISCNIRKKKAKLPQIIVDNMVKIYTKKNSKEHFFYFKGTGFNNRFNTNLPLQSKENDGVDRALKLLVDMSLIELISKFKHYDFDILEEIDKKDAR